MISTVLHGQRIVVGHALEPSGLECRCYRSYEEDFLQIATSMIIVAYIWNVHCRHSRCFNFSSYSHKTRNRDAVIILLRYSIDHTVTRYSVTSVVRATPQVNGGKVKLPLSPHPPLNRQSSNIAHVITSTISLPICHIWSRSPHGSLLPI